MKYHVYINEITLYHTVIDADKELSHKELIKEAIRKISNRNCARVGRSTYKVQSIYEESSNKELWGK